MKCFSMGMRKDFILTEEEKQKRRERLQRNRQLLTEHSSTKGSISISNNYFISDTISEIDHVSSILTRFNL